MKTTIRCKFRVDSVTARQGSHDKDGKPTTSSTVKLFAVTDDGQPENERFHRYTPSGAIDVQVDNPSIDVAKQFPPGSLHYVDLIPVESETE